MIQALLLATDNVAFKGEYAAISSNPNDIFGTPEDGRFVFPVMSGTLKCYVEDIKYLSLTARVELPIRTGSAGEAAFMTGLERNADIVFAASYAPLLNVRVAVIEFFPKVLIHRLQHIASSQWVSAFYVMTLL